MEKNKLSNCDESVRCNSLTHFQMIIILVLFLFSIVTAVALWHHGYWGIFELQLQSFAAAQVLVDLLIALSLVLVWMWSDSRKNKRVFWPWALLTLAVGSFGPLFYLLMRKPSQN